MKTSSKNLPLLIAAFAAIYIIWGSTYLAIRLAIESIPPFIMAGSRFVIAGTILYIVAILTGSAIPVWGEIKRSGLVGFLLLAVGNGSVVWVERTLPSGIAALIVTIEPFWVVLITQLITKNKGVTLYTYLGLILGAAGMYILLGFASGAQSLVVDQVSLIILLLSTLAFAAGSVYSSQATMPASPMMSTSIQMLVGGGSMLLLATLRGEWLSVDVNLFTQKSITAFVYLIFFGSIIGYTAYSWLTTVATPSQVSTYAYVNPVIAVLLGTFIGGEPLTKEILIATPVLVLAVSLLIKNPKPEA